jgi:Glycosyl transferase family 2
MPSSLAPELRFWLDEPRPEAAPSSALYIKGWCFDVSGSTITGIRVRVGSHTYTAKVGISRPDVLAYYTTPASTAVSGFSVCFTLPAGKSELYLEAKREGIAWTRFETLHQTSPLLRGFTFSFTHAWFYICVVLGKKPSLNRLTASELSYLYANFEERHGEPPLQLVAQHAPKEPRKETFHASSLSAHILPKITLVTPSYNHERFLEATIHSVLSQTGVRLDYIIQDGASTDGSVGIIERYKDKLKYFESSKDKGQADAIMKGFRHMQADPDSIMAYLNSDDLLMPGALRFIAEYFAQNPDVDAVYGHRVLINEEGLEVGQWVTPRQKCDNLSLHDLIPQETLFWRKRIWDRVGGIDVRFQFALDWDLLIRFQATGANIKRLPYFLGLFRIHSNQKSQSQIDNTGVPEMNLLRKRTLGKQPTEQEISLSMKRAQVDSTLVKFALQYGVRL